MHNRVALMGIFKFKGPIFGNYAYTLYYVNYYYLACTKSACTTPSVLGLFMMFQALGHAAYHVHVALQYSAPVKKSSCSKAAAVSDSSIPSTYSNAV